MKKTFLYEDLRLNFYEEEKFIFYLEIAKLLINFTLVCYL